MNIVACVKQIPNVAEIRFDQRTKTIVREGVTLQFNSLDRRSMQEAILQRDAHGGTVTAISMGPPQAKAVLAEAIAMGADRAILLSDRAFAGADTLATARTLAAAINKLQYDLVFCGRFTLDSETAQVGPQLAEFLGIPHASNAARVEFDPSRSIFKVDREVEEGIQSLEVQLPCLLTAGEFLNRPFRPTPDQIKAVDDARIETWTLADLGLDEQEVGSAGSPTLVYGIQEMTVAREKQVIAGEAPEVMARKLMDYLLGKGLFTEWQREGDGGFVPGEKTDPRPDRAVWVVAETALGQLRPVSLELLGRASEMAAGLNSEVVAVLVGDHVTRHADTLAAHGADRVLIAESPSLDQYHPDLYTQVVSDAVGERKPWAVLFSATVNGRDLAPRVAARLQLGLTGDCVGLEVDNRERLVQLKPAFGGNIIAPIRSRTSPAMATIRAGMLSRATPVPGRKPVVELLPAPDSVNGRLKVTGFEVTAGEEGAELDTAETVVGIGAGLPDKADVGMLRELAHSLGGTVGTTLAGVREGVLPGPLQIGLTGRSIAPRFYLGVAISGMLNHTIGLGKAGTIAVINKDPDAPFFNTCDFGVVGDYREIVPQLIKLAQEARAVRA